jgi:tryptophan 2,3-dioxygenase
LSQVTEQDIIDTAERGRDRSLAVRAAAAHRSLGYADYLQLDKVLGAQRPQSAMFSSEAHDEMLFIVIHQAYELWFKQILHELDSVNAALSLSGGKRRVADADVSVCALRTGRICEILRVLVQQFAVLETMSAQGFNDFRDFLTPASGFQSAQFRTMENKLGMRPEQRVQHSGCPYYRHLAREAERVEVLEAERETGLLALAGAWLETLLDDCCGGFDFAAYMADAVEQAAVHDRAAIEQYPSVRRGPAACPATAARSRVEQKAAALEELEQKRRAHLKLFDKAAHDELIAKGARHLSFKATMACVFVESFALELSLQTAHRLVSNLVEIDELIARWRHRHSGMVLRMIGTKSGTGGSSGHAYLNAVQHKSRIFVDLCHCAHYLLPQHAMPPLPPAVRARLARRLDHADLVESPLMSRNASADALDALASAQRHRAKSFT